MKFAGLEWYWWLAIAAALIILIPIKIRFMKWWAGRQEKKKDRRGKWGEEE